MNSATNPEYLALCRHYESCFDREGDNHKGVDWPSQKDTITRYKVMSDSFANFSNIEILDIGCGLAHYLDYLQSNEKNKQIRYRGLDISEKFISYCKAKYPEVPFIQLDLLQSKLDFNIDFCIMNGLFTVKRELSHEQIFRFMKEMLKVAFSISRIGIAFNVMSKNVDWERNDLFHVSMDQLSAFLTSELSRHYIIRNDYGLYEYTVYVYHLPLGAP